MTTFVSSCGRDIKQIDLNATRVGEAKAKVQLGPLPPECGTVTPHAALIKGQELLTLYDRERSQLDKSNDSKLRCNDFHNNQAVQLAK